MKVRKLWGSLIPKQRQKMRQNYTIKAMKSEKAEKLVFDEKEWYNALTVADLCK